MLRTPGNHGSELERGIAPVNLEQRTAERLFLWMSQLGSAAHTHFLLNLLTHKQPSHNTNNLTYTQFTFKCSVYNACKSKENTPIDIYCILFMVNKTEGACGMAVEKHKFSEVSDPEVICSGACLTPWLVSLHKVVLRRVQLSSVQSTPS